MKETAMHFLTAIVFAGIASLALAALHKPAEKPARPGAREINISENITDDNDNIADDWRFSAHESIREQTREQIQSRTRQGLQISQERVAFAEPDSSLSLQAFRSTPADDERMFSK